MDFGMPFLLQTHSIRECCKLCNELGLSFVELNANFPACAGECLNHEELTSLAREHGIYFTLHVEEECNPFSFNAHVRQAWLNTLRDVLRLAVQIGAPIVNLHFPHGVYITLPDQRVYLYEQHKEIVRYFALELRTLCENMLLGTDTMVTIENTDGWAPHERELIELLLESPRFGLTLDIGHSHAAGDVDEDFFRANENKLVHMHGHDARGRSNHLPLGEGEIDLRQRFRWAAQRNARIVLETKTCDALRKSLEWLRNKF